MILKIFVARVDNVYADRAATYWFSAKNINSFTKIHEIKQIEPLNGKRSQKIGKMCLKEVCFLKSYE